MSHPAVRLMHASADTACCSMRLIIRSCRTNDFSQIWTAAFMMPKPAWNPNNLMIKSLLNNKSLGECSSGCFRPFKNVATCDRHHAGPTNMHLNKVTVSRHQGPLLLGIDCLLEAQKCCKLIANNQSKPGGLYVHACHAITVSKYDAWLHQQLLQ